MVVKSVINEEALNAMGLLIIGKKRMVLLVSGSVLFLLYTVFSLFIRSYGGVAFGVICEAILVLESYLIKRRSVKLSLDRVEESRGSRDISVLIDCLEDETYMVEKSDNGSSHMMNYNSLSSLTERNGYAYLWTKALQFFVFSLAQFESQQQKMKFYEILKKQAPDLKMKVKK